MARCNRTMLLRQLLRMITLAEGPCAMRVPEAMLEMQSWHAGSSSSGLQHLASPLASTKIDHRLLPNLLIDGGDAVMARWLQSAGLQHLASPLASTRVEHRLLSNLLMQRHRNLVRRIVVKAPSIEFKDQLLHVTWNN
ncbi:hypothetical protein TEA_005736 [Camellia sinensis var. sinensis]|uniref:Uncharacterized protein n=1 Tax=Camellia sinensis var. sinensis TaxID=542762 RepID=A0A4S4DPC8_CAMSN|nr:hypothetical protein TEA_005736 [Camellia sinensis var. sinensis]